MFKVIIRQLKQVDQFSEMFMRYFRPKKKCITLIYNAEQVNITI